MIDYASGVVDRLFGRVLKGRLARATSGSFLLKIAAAGSAILISLVLARALGAAGYGAYAYALAWVNLLCIPAQAGFEKLVVREVSVHRAAGRWDLLRGILRTANGISLGLSLGIGALAAAAVWLWRGYLEPGMVVPLWIGLGLLPVLSLTRLRQSAMMGLQRVVRGQVPEAVVRPFLFIGMVLAAYALLGDRFTAVQAVALNLVAAAVAFTLGAWMLAAAVRETVPAGPVAYTLKPWLGSAWRLGLLAGLQVANGRLDILMLGMFRGAEEVGIYSVAVRGAMLISFVLMAVNTAVAPSIASLFSREDQGALQRLITRSTWAIVAFAAPITAGLVIFGRPLLGLFGPDFVGGYTALTILCAGQFVNAAAGSVGLILTMTKHESLAATGSAVALGVNVVLNLLLIPRWGIEGAAAASLVTLVVWNGLFAYWVYRRVGIVPAVFGSMRPRPGG